MCIYIYIHLSFPAWQLPGAVGPPLGWLGGPGNDQRSIQGEHGGTWRSTSSIFGDLTIPKKNVLFQQSKQGSFCMYKLIPS